MKANTKKTRDKLWTKKASAAEAALDMTQAMIDSDYEQGKIEAASKAWNEWSKLQEKWLELIGEARGEN